MITLQNKGATMLIPVPIERYNFLEIKLHSFAKIKQDFTKPAMHAVAGYWQILSILLNN